MRKLQDSDTKLLEAYIRHINDKTRLLSILNSYGYMYVIYYIG